MAFLDLSTASAHQREMPPIRDTRGNAWSFTINLPVGVGDVDARLLAQSLQVGLDRAVWMCIFDVERGAEAMRDHYHFQGFLRLSEKTTQMTRKSVWRTYLLPPLARFILQDVNDLHSLAQGANWELSPVPANNAERIDDCIRYATKRDDTYVAGPYISGKRPQGAQLAIISRVHRNEPGEEVVIPKEVPKPSEYFEYQRDAAAYLEKVYEETQTCATLIHIAGPTVVGKTKFIESLNYYNDKFKGHVHQIALGPHEGDLGANAHTIFEKDPDAMLLYIALSNGVSAKDWKKFQWKDIELLINNEATTWKYGKGKVTFNRKPLVVMVSNLYGDQKPDIIGCLAKARFMHFDVDLVDDGERGRAASAPQRIRALSVAMSTRAFKFCS